VFLHLPLRSGNRYSPCIFPDFPPKEGFTLAGAHGVLHPQQCLGFSVDLCNRGADQAQQRKSYIPFVADCPSILFLACTSLPYCVLTRGTQVLPGEDNWGAGQILAMVLILIPLLGFVNVMLTSLGNHSTSARRWIKVDCLVQPFSLSLC